MLNEFDVLALTTYVGAELGKIGAIPKAIIQTAGESERSTSSFSPRATKTTYFGACIRVSKLEAISVFQSVQS